MARIVFVCLGAFELGRTKTFGLLQCSVMKSRRPKSGGLYPWRRPTAGDQSSNCICILFDPFFGRKLLRLLDFRAEHTLRWLSLWLFSRNCAKGLSCGASQRPNVCEAAVIHRVVKEKTRSLASLSGSFFFPRRIQNRPPH